MDNDAELIEHTLAGNRQAFGLLVERYQSLICAVSYSATGDLDLSEDIAQETFLTAWKRLAELRDRTRLRAWLCGIARNLVRNVFRSRGAELVRRAAPLEEAAEARSSAPSPRELAVSREEEAILWRALEEIPESCREPMILFYREQRSVQAVAAALELSEDAVKQRLSRGRKLLRAQVAAFVETTLSRTRPTKVFTLAVLAALPAVGAQAAAAGVAAAAAKGAGAAQAATMAGLSGAVLGPLLGLLGAYIGARAGIRNTRSPRERAFMVKATWIILAFVSVVLALTAASVLFLRSLWQPSGSALTAVVIGGSVVCIACLFALITWVNRRQRQIQQEDGTYIEPVYQPIRASKRAIYGSFAGAIFGPVCWIVPFTFIARDWLTLAATLLFAATLFLTCARAAFRKPRNYYRIAGGALLLLGLFNLTVVNLRWGAWMDAFRQSRFYDRSSDMPLWLINVLIVGVCVLLAVVLLLISRKQRALREKMKNGGNCGPR